MEVIRQDVGQVITLQIKEDGSAMNLSGATVSLVLSDGREYLCSVSLPATAGVATRTTQAGDFPSAAQLQAVVKVVVGGATLYSKPFAFDVKDLFS